MKNTNNNEDVAGQQFVTMDVFNQNMQQFQQQLQQQLQQQSQLLQEQMQLFQEQIQVMISKTVEEKQTVIENKEKQTVIETPSPTINDTINSNFINTAPRVVNSMYNNINNSILMVDPVTPATHVPIRQSLGGIYTNTNNGANVERIVMSSMKEFNVSINKDYTLSDLVDIIIKRDKYIAKTGVDVKYQLIISDDVKETIVNRYLTKKYIQEGKEYNEEAYSLETNRAIFSGLVFIKQPKTQFEYIKCIQANVKFPHTNLKSFSLFNISEVTDLIMQYSRNFINIWSLLRFDDTKLEANNPFGRSDTASKYELPAWKAQSKLTSTNSSTDQPRTMVELFLSMMPYKLGRRLHEVFMAYLSQTNIDATRYNFHQYVLAFKKWFQTQHDACEERVSFVKALQEYANGDRDYKSSRSYAAEIQQHDFSINDIHNNAAMKELKPVDESAYCLSLLRGKMCPKGKSCPYNHSKEGYDKFIRMAKNHIPTGHAIDPILLAKPRLALVPHVSTIGEHKSKNITNSCVSINNQPTPIVTFNDNIDDLNDDGDNDSDLEAIDLQHLTQDIFIDKTQPLNVKECILGSCIANTSASISKPVVNGTAYGQHVNILLDSGDTAGDFINEDFFNEHVNTPDIEVIHKPKTVRLADNITMYTIPVGYILTIQLKYNDEEYIHTGIFYPMKTNREFIIGHHTLIGSAFLFFRHVYDSYHKQWLEDKSSQCAIVDNDDNNDTNDNNDIDVTKSYKHPETGRILYEPFKYAHQIAPEEDNIPDPHTNSNDLLHSDFFDKNLTVANISDDYDQRLQSYKDKVSQQIDENFLEVVPDFVNHLLTKEVIDIFVYDNWNGLCDPVTNETYIHELKWKAIPTSHKAHNIRVKPDLIERAQLEFQHLKNIGYYQDSTSHIASSLILAAKATTPYFRIVAAYGWLSTYLANPHYPIPIIKDTIATILNGHLGKSFRLFCEFDMLASYHQLKIDAASSAYLSIVTPWGQVEPAFLCEGIGPATSILQQRVEIIFAEMKDRLITIFDNFLLLAVDEEDMIIQFNRFMKICTKSNMKLKLSKCNFGITEVNFFGYLINGISFRLDDTRGADIAKIPFPADVGTNDAAKKKYMQSYLGAGNFYCDFIPNYSVTTAPLYDMIKKNFNWDINTWTIDYRAIFQQHKDAIQNSYTLYYPDYNKEWVIRTDASEKGCGGILFQKHILEDGSIVNQPLYMTSHKFSEQASNWHTMEQEAYAIFHILQKLAHLLRGKQVIIQTDHRNLVWIEKSKDGKIIRMAQFMAPLKILIEHIPGKLQLVADMLSRLLPGADSCTIEACAIDIFRDRDDFFYAGIHLSNNFVFYADELVELDIIQNDHIDIDLNDIIAKVHGGREGHPGINRTWAKLNKYFPGSGITVTDIENFICKCPTCQRTRTPNKNVSLVPITKSLPLKHNRYMIAVDTAKVTDTPRGNKYLLVVVNMFTKFVHLFPVPDKSALQTARCLFTYYCTYGVCDYIHSDQGSDFTSIILAYLHKWLGIRRSLALVQRPQADGVEPTIKYMLLHLIALCNDERLADNWDMPENIGIIQLIMNETVHGETNVSPLQATFGTADSHYFALPILNENDNTADSNYVQKLTEYLDLVRKLSLEYQNKCKNKRTFNPDFVQNRLQEGQYVLYKLSKLEKANKLTPIHSGPFQVISHKEGDNSVLCRNLVTGDDIKLLHIDRLMIFVGDDKTALEEAIKNENEYSVLNVLGFQGDPTRRNTIQFFIKFADGDEIYVPFSQNIISNDLVHKFIMSHRYLPIRLLLGGIDSVQHMRERCLSVTIPISYEYHKFYLNMRYYGTWYDQRIDLPDRHSINYYVEANFSRMRNHKNKDIAMHIPIFNTKVFVDYFIVEYWANVTTLMQDEILLTPQLCKKYDLYT